MTPKPRSTGGLLLDRSFGPWFWGGLVSNSGSWLYNVTAAVVMFELTGSAFFVGLVSAAQFSMLALLSPWAGALSDRLDRRKVAVAGQAFASASAVGIAVPALVLGIDALGPWALLLATLGIGIGRAFAEPAMASLVPALVDDVDLESAVALNSLTYNAGRAIGPMGAGVALLTFGPGVAFAINAGSFLAHIAALLVVRIRPRSDAARGDGSVRAGMRYVLQDRTTLMLLGGVTMVGFAADPVITLAPSLTEVLRGGDGLVAAMVSGFGSAAAVTGLLSGRLQRAVGSLRLARAGMLLMAAGLSLAAVASRPWVALAGFSVTGIGFILSTTSFTTVLQRRVPDGLRGRIMALWLVAFLGTRPIASLINGAAADAAGPRSAMVIAVMAAFMGAWTALLLRRSERPLS